MSEIQEIFSGFAEALENGTLGGCDLRLLIRALDGVPDCFHSQIIKAAFGMVKPETEEAPEDYLAVKTFDSREFHVGDEIQSEITGDRMIVLKNSESGDKDRIYCMFSDGSTGIRDKYKYHRTGRNFPAIAAIMEELTK